MDERIEIGAAVELSGLGGGSPVVALRGELDLASVDQVSQQLAPVIRAGPDEVVFDLSDLEFMDSSGIALLIQVRNAVKTVRLVNVSPIVRRLLEATGLTEAFGVVP